MFGKGRDLDPDRPDISKVMSMINWQSDYLAQAILMPTGPVKRCYNERRFGSGSGMTQKQTVSEMSDIFGVPEIYMEARLDSLGLKDS